MNSAANNQQIKVEPRKLSEEHKIVRNSGSSITDRKCLNGKSKGNGFEFEITRNSK